MLNGVSGGELGLVKLTEKPVPVPDGTFEPARVLRLDKAVVITLLTVATEGLLLLTVKLLASLLPILATAIVWLGFVGSKIIEAG